MSTIGNRQTQIEIFPNDRISDVVSRLSAAYGLAELRLENPRVSMEAPAANLAGDRNTILLVNQVTGEEYNVFLEHGSGVTYNVALKGASQWNTALGPGSRVAKNRAIDEGTKQRNTSACVII